MKRKHFLFKIFTLITIFSFIVNLTMTSVAQTIIADKSCLSDKLAVQSIFKTIDSSSSKDPLLNVLYERGIDVSPMLEFNILSGIRLLLLGHNHQDVNGMICESGSELVTFLSCEENNISSGKNLKARFKVKSKEDVVFKVEYNDMKNSKRDDAGEDSSTKLKHLSANASRIYFSTEYDSRAQYVIEIKEDQTLPELIIEQQKEPAYMLIVKRASGEAFQDFPIAVITGILPFEKNGLSVEWVTAFDYKKILETLDNFIVNHSKLNWSLKDAMGKYMIIGPDRERKLQMKILYNYLFTEKRLETDEKVYEFFSAVGRSFAQEALKRTQADMVKNISLDMKRRGISRAATEFLTSFNPVGSRLRFRIVNEPTIEALDAGKDFKDTILGSWFNALGYDILNMEKSSRISYPVAVLEKKRTPSHRTIWQDPEMLGEYCMPLKTSAGNNIRCDLVSAGPGKTEATGAEVITNTGGKKILTVLETGKEPYVYIGFKKDVSAGEDRIQFEKDLRDGNSDAADKYLNKILIRKGDVFFLPAGGIYSMTAGTKIASIGGDKAEGEMPDGKNFINTDEKYHRLVAKDISEDGKIWRLGTTDDFTVERLEFDGENSRTDRMFPVKNRGNLLLCTKGKVEVSIAGGDDFFLTEGDTGFIPDNFREYTFKAIGKTEVLNVWSPEDPENRTKIDGVDLVDLIDQLVLKGIDPMLAGRELKTFRTNFRLMEFFKAHCVVKNPGHIANVLNRGIEKGADDAIFKALFGPKTPDRSDPDKFTNVVMLRGGRGGSKFTETLVAMPDLKVTTIVAGTDDGRSWFDAAQEFDATGVPDARKCISDYLAIHSPLLKKLNEGRFMSSKKEYNKPVRILSTEEQLINDLDQIVEHLKDPKKKVHFSHQENGARDILRNYIKGKRGYPYFKWKDFTGALDTICKEIKIRKAIPQYKFQLDKVPVGSLLFLGVKLQLEEKMGKGKVPFQDIIDEVMRIYGVNTSEFNVLSAAEQQVHLMGMLKDGTIFLTETGVNEYTRTGAFHELVYVKKELVDELLNTGEIAGCKVERLEEYNPEKYTEEEGGDKEIYETIRKLSLTTNKNIKRVASFLRKKSREANFTANPKAVEALEKADISILVPTTNFSNMNPSLTLAGISDAYKSSKAFKTWFMNMAKDDCDERGELSASFILEGIVRSSNRTLKDYGQIDWWKNAGKIVKYVIGQPEKYQRLAEVMPDPRDEREYLLMNAGNFKQQEITPVGLRMEKNAGTSKPRKDYSDAILFGLYDPDLMVDALFSLYNLDLHGYGVDIKGDLVYRTPVPSRVRSEYMNKAHKDVIFLKREKAEGNNIMSRCRDAIRQYKDDINSGILLEGEVRCNMDALRRDIALIERRKADKIFKECQGIIDRSNFTEKQRRELTYLMSEIYEDHYIPHASGAQARKANGIHYGVHILRDMLKIAISEKVSYREMRKVVVLPFMHDIAYEYLDEISTPSDLIYDEEEARSSVQAKLEQANKASAMAGEKFRELQESSEILGLSDVFDAQEIEDMCLIIEKYCTPTIKKIMNKYPNIKDIPTKDPDSEDKIARYLREAGRLWMISGDGLSQEISRSADHGISMTIADRVKEVDENYKKERELSRNKQKMKGDTLFISDISYELYIDYKEKAMKTYRQKDRIEKNINKGKEDEKLNGESKEIPHKDIIYEDVFRKGDEVKITRMNNRGQNKKKTFDMEKGKNLDASLGRISKGTDILTPLLMKASRGLTNKPVNMFIDLSMMSFSGLTEGQKKEQLEKNLHTLAVMMVWHNSYGIEARYMIENDPDGKALIILQGELARISRVNGINTDSILKGLNNPYKTVNSIDVRLDNILSVKKRKAIGDREYVVALKDNNLSGTAIPDYISAGIMGLSLAALRFINDQAEKDIEKQKQYNVLKNIVLEKFKKIYLNKEMIEDKNIFTIHQLELMVSGSSATRLYYSILYAIPPAAKLMVEDINKCHERLQEIIFAA